MLLQAAINVGITKVSTVFIYQKETEDWKKTMMKSDVEENVYFTATLSCLPNNDIKE